MAHSKLILAVLQGEDYGDVVRQLNENGIFVTILHSTGGFLRKRSVTIMIGVEEAKLEQVLDLLKETAGRRTVTLYQNPGSMPPPHGSRRCLPPPPWKSAKAVLPSSCWTWNVWKNIDLFILKLKIHTTQGKGPHFVVLFLVHISASRRRLLQKEESGGSPSPVSRLT